MAPKKKPPISSADLGAVVGSAAAGARQALAKGDLNGASVAMLTLSMAVANPSIGGAASGAHVHLRHILRRTAEFRHHFQHNSV